MPLNNNLFYIDVDAIKQKIELLPVVAEVNVQRKLPKTILLHIKEREPALVLCVQGRFILTDVEGFYIREIEFINEYNNLLVITGIEVEQELSLGSRVDNELLTIAAKVFKEIWEDYGHFFAEIDFSLGENDIILYTNEGLTVKIGSTNNLSQKMVVFEKLYLEKTKQPDFYAIEYLDISFLGLPVLKYR